MPKDREVSKGIVFNPHRCGGNPTVRGTRVTASMLANLMSGPDPVSVRWIIDNYPHLTYADLSNVNGWDRKGRPGELIP